MLAVPSANPAKKNPFVLFTLSYEFTLPVVALSAKTWVTVGFVFEKNGAYGDPEGFVAGLSTETIVAPPNLAASTYYINDEINDEPASMDVLTISYKDGDD